MPKSLKYIDLFAGCGGLSLGLFNSGWQGIFAVEKDSMAFETLSYNLVEQKKHFDWPDWLPKTCHDIDELLEDYRENLEALNGEIDLVAGGPPCQGFSMAGKRKESDARNRLIHSYIQFVDYVRPRVILFENVKGFTLGFNKNGKRGQPYSDVVLSSLRELGYRDVRGELLNFAKFGVPQKRERFIIIGTLEGNAGHFFSKLLANRQKFLSAKKLKSNMGVRLAISDLKESSGLVDCPDTPGFKSGRYVSRRNNYQKLLRKYVNKTAIPDSHRFVNHRPNTIDIYKSLLSRAERNISVNDALRKKLGISKRNVTVLDSTKPSPTLMSIPDDYVHYCEPRVLTVREYARIQSFPDWYKFRSNYTTGGKRRANEVPRYTQIGNAIPPLFAEHAGNILKELLD
ncbi:DNA cytosine methyltransferase [bacterium]|nr:DNA cytosine methyltransferase [bacterium]